MSSDWLFLLDSEWSIPPGSNNSIPDSLKNVSQSVLNYDTIIKFVRTYSPFLGYFVCVALAYFLCFYLFPKYNAALAYLGFLIIYTYIDIGVFILGFFMGKIIVKRSIDIGFLLCLIYALISFGLMLLIGSLKYVFYDYMYSNFTFTFSIFIESLGDRDSLFVSIGTFVSFFIGEIIEYINDKSNS